MYGRVGGAEDSGSRLQTRLVENAQLTGRTPSK
jgi:hypothetical protein